MKVLRIASLLAAPVGALLSHSAFAVNPEAPASFVENYRIESQYGAGEAVLNPIFSHEQRVELSGGATYQATSSLVNYGTATGSLTYHINARHAVEPVYFGHVFGGRFTKFLKDEIVNNPDANNAASATVEMPKLLYAASYLFSPFYAKMHITEQTVTHFDVYFGLGVGVVKTEDQILGGGTGNSQTRPAASLAAGIRFLFPNHFALRAELRDFVYTSKNFGQNGTGNNFQLGLAASVFLF